MVFLVNMEYSSYAYDYTARGRLYLLLVVGQVTQRFGLASRCSFREVLDRGDYQRQRNTTHGYEEVLQHVIVADVQVQLQAGTRAECAPAQQHDSKQRAQHGPAPPPCHTGHNERRGKQA